MKAKYILALTLCMLVVYNFVAQEKRSKTIEISGTITNEDNKAIRGAILYVDSAQTRTKTNKKGYFKIKLKTTPHHVAVYSPEYGIFTLDFKEKKQVYFSFPTKVEEEFTRADLLLLGYKAPLFPN